MPPPRGAPDTRTHRWHKVYGQADQKTNPPQVPGQALEVGAINWVLYLSYPKNKTGSDSNKCFHQNIYPKVISLGDLLPFHCPPITLPDPVTEKLICGCPL